MLIYTSTSSITRCCCLRFWLYDQHAWFVHMRLFGCVWSVFFYIYKYTPVYARLLGHCDENKRSRNSTPRRLGPLNICKCLRRDKLVIIFDKTGICISRSVFWCSGLCLFLFSWWVQITAKHGTLLVYLFGVNRRLPRNEFVRSWPLTRFLDRVICGGTFFFAPRTSYAHSPPRRMDFFTTKTEIFLLMRARCAVTLSSIIFVPRLASLALCI